MKKSLNSRLSKSLLCAGCAFLIVDFANAKPYPSKGKGGNSGNGRGSDKAEERATDQGGGKGNKGDKGNKGEKGKGAKGDDKAEAWRSHRFEEKDRTSMTTYFKGFETNPQGLPPGLAKKLKNGKALPPGWQKKVTEGYIIEETNNKFFHPLEYSLFPELVAVPDTRLYLYGNRVVRVYEPNRQIIDFYDIPSIKLN